MQGNDKAPNVILYMMRHLLTVNVPDPLSDASRGITEYTQYFSGNGNAGLINYLERKPTSSGRFLVYINTGTDANPVWTEKANGTDYTLDYSKLTITWTGFTPPDDLDNIKVTYTSVMPWIYDDQPQLDATYFPRITVMALGTEKTDSGQGIYTNYTQNVGQFNEFRIKAIVRHRKNEPRQGLIYTGLHLKNYDLVLEMSENVERYLNSNRVPIPWKFWDWMVLRSERIYSEEDTDNMLRQDLTVNVKYYRSPSAPHAT